MCNAQEYTSTAMSVAPLCAAECTSCAMGQDVRKRWPLLMTAVSPHAKEPVFSQWHRECSCVFLGKVDECM